MTDLEKPKRKPRAKKPPTQTAGVSGIDAHGGMGEVVEPADFEQHIDWRKLTSLPAFEMFVREQSGHDVGSLAGEWINSRRDALGDSVFYDKYAEWHKNKGLWLNESPIGNIS